MIYFALIPPVPYVLKSLAWTFGAVHRYILQEFYTMPVLYFC